MQVFRGCAVSNGRRGRGSGEPARRERGRTRRKGGSFRRRQRTSAGQAVSAETRIDYQKEQPPLEQEGDPMRRLRRLALPPLAAVTLGGILLFARGDRLVTFSAPAKAATAAITFETPAVADPIHTWGEPSIAVDPTPRALVSVSGPTGTGTQRSA